MKSSAYCSFVSFSGLAGNGLRTGQRLSTIGMIGMDPSGLDGSSLITSVANAWSVSGADLDSADLASSLFASSLFPYLGLLFFLSRKPTNTPPLANFGFQFLLFFVFATIPAGIIAKTQYGDILANVDWLHGSAEAMLTVTNLLIIFGFRSMREEPVSNTKGGIDVSSLRYVDFLIPTAVALSVLGIPQHAEPSNALSLPTWFVHTSSVIEWVVAMKMVRAHAEVSGNPRWKGMALAMVPSQASGLCACTYHLFYNSVYLGNLVTLQAALTVLGNTTMGLAAYRVFAYARQKERQEKGLVYRSKGLAEVKNALFNKYDDSKGKESAIEGRLNLSWLETVFSMRESEARREQVSRIVRNPVPNTANTVTFSTDLLLKAALLAPIVKYGELYLDFPFDGGGAGSLPLALIFLPAAINALSFL